MSTTLERTTVHDDLAPRRRAVRQRLAAIRRRARGQLLLEGVVWTCATVVLLAAASLAIDWLLRLSLPSRLVLLAAAIVAIAIVVQRWLVRPLLVRLSDLDLAELLDRRSPGIAQRMANVLQLPDLIAGPYQASPSMVRAAVIEQAGQLDSTDWNALWNAGRRSKLLAVLCGFAAAVVVFLVLCPATAGLWARRWLMGSQERWPQNTYLAVVGLGDQSQLLIPRGESVLVQVDGQPRFTKTDEGWRLDGRGEPLVIPHAERPESRLPGQVSLRLTSATAPTRQGNFTLFEASNFRYELPPLDEPAEMTVNGGDDWLGPIELVPIDRPTVQSMSIEARTNGQSTSRIIQVGETDSQLLFLPKTQLKLRLTAGEPLERAELICKSEPPPEWKRIDEQTYEAAWEMSEPVAMEFHLVGRRGALSSKPYFLSIGVLQDREPRVTIHATGVGRRVTPQAKIPLSVRALDDFGLVETGLEMEKTVLQGEQPQTSSETLEIEKLADVAGASPVTERNRSLTLDLAEREVSRGDLVKLRGTALDNCPLGAHAGYSRWLSFQIVSPEELFYEILMRQREQRARFGAAVQAAKAQIEPLEALALPEQVSGLLRKHQVVERQVLQVAIQLDATLAEMTLNDLGTEQARELLADSIIKPLRTLHDGPLALERARLEGLAAAKAIEPDRRDEAAESQQEIVQTMQRILEQMSQWESFVDVVNQLKQVIKLQDQVLKSTEDVKNKQTKALFDDD